MKRCKICGEDKPLNQFPAAVTTRDKKDIYCIPCKHLAQASWYERNREGLRAKRMLWRAKARASKRGLEFSITLNDIEPLPTTCPILGIAINYNRKVRWPGPDSPSLDRKNNELGYIPGNVMVISNRANSIKSDASAAEVRRVADFMDAL